MGSEYLCANQSTVKVVTERIPYRFPDLGHIGYNEGLYIIEACLKGGKIIAKNHGTFHFD